LLPEHNGKAGACFRVKIPWMSTHLFTKAEMLSSSEKSETSKSVIRKCGFTIDAVIEKVAIIHRLI